MSASFLVDVLPYPAIRAEQFFHRGHPLALQSLSSQMTNKSFPFWSYTQIRHFLDRFHPRTDWSRQLTPFESICLRQEPQRHLISDIYAILFANYDPKCNEASRRWEQDLSLDLSKSEWENIYTFIHKGTVNVHTQENWFKFFSRWYRTSLKLQKVLPTITFALEYSPAQFQLHHSTMSKRHTYAL